MNSKAEKCVTESPRPFESLIFLFALLVQQDAFITLPILMKNASLAEMRDLDNPLNGISIALSLLCIGWISLSRLRVLTGLARANKLAVLFICLVVLSTSWSIHPDVTIRRAAGYILTMLVAALLPIRFGIERFMNMLSLSFAVSAIVSFAFVLIAPGYGIMQEGDLAGCWQGVFCTKESLGSVMAVAVFVEAYVLILCKGMRRWRYGLLVLYFSLVILSRSKTALLTVVIYLAGAGVFVLWRRNRRLRVVGVMAVICTLLSMLVVFRLGSYSALSALGKDSTLTGRTELWHLVLELVKERPLLGWGYRAMWQASDPMTTWIDNNAGFKVPSSHNAFLEIALQLGWIGLVLMSLFIFAALRRGARCCAMGWNPLGWFSMMFLVGTLMAGLTTETLGQGQVIEWVVLNSLVFSCGVRCRTARASKSSNWSVIESQSVLT